jgi:CheY-like chemotaxis protein
MIGSAPVEENLNSGPPPAPEIMPDSTERTTPVTAADPEPGRLLVVDDDQSACEFLESILRRQYKVTWRTSAHDALEMVADQDFDVILTDLNMTDIGGLDLCERIVGIRPDIPVIVVTGYGSMEAAIGAIRAGAYDFVTKPVDATVIELTVDRALRHRRLQEEVKRLRKAAALPQGFDAIIGRSPAMRRVFDLITRVSDTEATVMITGESGTGKELVAKAIHAQSNRREGPFLAINCAAMPPALLESELFGHTRGAFTDAKAARVGLFAEATGGALCKSGRSGPSAAITRFPSMPASLPRPIAISRRKCSRSGSAKTCIIASTSWLWRCRRCGNAGAISCSWRSISRSERPPAPTRRSKG